jgi:luciferase family oxidoreductase group 1
VAADFALSLQDLAPIAQGTSTPEAMAETVRLAEEADRLGFTRLWYAEHHGMPSIASSVPEILIASAAAATTSLRVGSGGVMLLNHAPLRIAEAYRTLEALHPGRIDLGLGRAPGGDGYAMRALRSGGGEEFSTYLAELMAFDEESFPSDHPLLPRPGLARGYFPAAQMAPGLIGRQRLGRRAARFRLCLCRPFFPHARRAGLRRLSRRLRALAPVRGAAHHPLPLGHLRAHR